MIRATPRTTETVSEPTLPAASVAPAVMEFAPRANGIAALKVPSTSATVSPFSVKTAIGLASSTVPTTWIEVSVVTVPAAGAVIVTSGGVVSSVTSTEASAEPKAFPAVAVSVFAPSVSGTEALKLAPLTAAATLLTPTETGAAPESVPLTRTGVAARSAPSRGALIVTVGGSVEGATPPTLTASVSCASPHVPPASSAPLAVARFKVGAASVRVW